MLLEGQGKDLSPKNWLMSGVINEIRAILWIFLQNNYHVIVVSQLRSPNPERPVTHIYVTISTLTWIWSYWKIILWYFYWKYFFHKNHYSAGISIINVSTGKSKITNVIQKFRRIKIIHKMKSKGLFLIIILLKLFFIQKIL